MTGKSLTFMFYNNPGRADFPITNSFSFCPIMLAQNNSLSSIFPLNTFQILRLTFYRKAREKKGAFIGIVNIFTLVSEQERMHVKLTLFLLLHFWSHISDTLNFFIQTFLQFIRFLAFINHSKRVLSLFKPTHLHQTITHVGWLFYFLLSHRLSYVKSRYYSSSW